MAQKKARIFPRFFPNLAQFLEFYFRRAMMKSYYRMCIAPILQWDIISLRLARQRTLKRKASGNLSRYSNTDGCALRVGQCSRAEYCGIEVPYGAFR